MCNVCFALLMLLLVPSSNVLVNWYSYFVYTGYRLQVSHLADAFIQSDLQVDI